MRWSKHLQILVLVTAVGLGLPVLCAMRRPGQLGGPASSPSPGTSSVRPLPPPAGPGIPQSEFQVMIDPAHGGDDKGVVFGSRIVEKNVTLALARELRNELKERGIASRLLRDSDTAISLDRRAQAANEQRSAIYVALHAGPLGKGVRVYWPLLVSQEPAVGRFLPWDSAQIPSLGRSGQLAKAVYRELQKKDLQASILRAPLRPLNNITAPAIAVELALQSGDPRSLESARFQNTVASAIAAAIAQERPHLEARP